MLARVLYVLQILIEMYGINIDYCEIPLTLAPFSCSWMNIIRI